MGFKAEHPDYNAYISADYSVNTVPSELMPALEGYIAKHCSGASSLKSGINDIAVQIPCEMTTNWGWGFLIYDLGEYLRRLKTKKFHKTMDFLLDVYERFQDEIDINDFNEFLDDCNLGYELHYNGFSGFSWSLRTDISKRTESVLEASNNVKDVCAQALDHLEQARTHLLETKSDRDRKDAIRDCLSAMESLLKNLAGETDIKKAITAMREEKFWGPDVIIKDGLGLWNRIHEMYPDVRHGSPEKSDITDEEALYWVERISTYIRYIAKINKTKT